MLRLCTGGKRKMLLAAALASGASLMPIDDPEAALDHSSISYLRQTLAEEKNATSACAWWRILKKYRM